MDLEGILELEDRLFQENRADEVEDLLINALSVASDEGEEMAVLQLLNELIGYYREASKFEQAYSVADEIKKYAEFILPVDSIPYATSILNVATAYRAGGRLDDALEEYKKVEEIYGRILEPKSRLMASLYNNESLLYQELGDFQTAKEMLVKALEIVRANSDQYEEAVSLANIAGTCMQLGELDEGYEYALKAKAMFEEQGVFDAHYAAALSAMGSYHYIKGEFEKGADIYKTAMDVMEKSLGKNAYYERLKENYDACREALIKNTAGGANAGLDSFDDTSEKKTSDGKKGLDICREYFERLGLPVIREKFPEYIHEMAFGLVGEGSDCYGFDDEVSRDHDWGPGFCIWVSDALYEKIGAKLQECYDELPSDFLGFKRAPFVQGEKRRGVIRISDFCLKYLGVGADDLEAMANGSEDVKNIRNLVQWEEVTDASLSAFINGEVWMDEAGFFTALRDQIAIGYPEPVLFAKLAQGCAEYSQAGQYNIIRCIKRGDDVTAEIMKADAMRAACKLAYYIENRFPPHDKWLYKGLDSLMGGSAVKEGLHTAVMCGSISSKAAPEDHKENAKSLEFILEKLGASLAMEMYVCDYISDVDPYLDHQTEELMLKSFYSAQTDEELTMMIAKAEFAAFDKVKNEGGRASCQNDWPTFKIMRRSQYLTWNRTMLLQYLYDFEREMRLGHNLITEKYGRMMESTAPEKYEEIKDNFPPLSEEQKAIIEEICRIQVQWMEEFSKEHPLLAKRARTVHTYDDDTYDTSYETYLRGEISTYSDKMLQLYTKFIVELSEAGKNLAKMTMENSCRLYGYKSLEEAEEFLKK